MTQLLICAAFMWFLHLVTEWLRLEGNTSHLIWLPRTMARWLLNVSKEGASTISLGNMYQCSDTITLKKLSPDVQREPPMLQLVSVASCPVSGHH